MSRNIFVERRPDGSYAVEKPGAERASAILPSQQKRLSERRKSVLTAART